MALDAAWMKCREEFRIRSFAPFVHLARATRSANIFSPTIHEASAGPRGRSGVPLGQISKFAQVVTLHRVLAYSLATITIFSRAARGQGQGGQFVVEICVFFPPLRDWLYCYTVTDAR